MFMPGSHVLRRHGHCCVGLWLLLAALTAISRGQQITFVEQPEVLSPGVSEPSAAPDGPARYDEPPPPPFDYWNPTWMPCQSLRTNRSLVLGHLWFGMDILGWSTKGVHAPPLVTSGSLAGGGIIGQCNTQILFGNEQLNNELRPGGRLTIGWWFDPNQYSGIEWHYFELDGQNTRFNAANNTGTSILA